MPLHIGGTGSGKPFVKYNAKADKWFARGEDGSDQEIARPTFIIDLPNIATGWLMFREGQAPERCIDPSLDQAAPSPGEGFKRGFVVMTFSQKFLGGAAEFSSASIHLSNAMKDIYSAWENQRGQHPGQLPVVACTGADPMKDKYGTNYRPKFEIVKWVDRPSDLPDANPIDPSDIWKSQGSGLGAPSRPQAAPVSPPARVPPPVPAQALASDPMLEAEF
ncbi:conserved hypothetical protein [Rhodospirillaceae bacterium LM-1]|nr:conserved hypothetical protein [Rhodospirillaceae bacterium LM-1]